MKKKCIASLSLLFILVLSGACAPKVSETLGVAAPARPEKEQVVTTEAYSGDRGAADSASSGGPTLSAEIEDLSERMIISTASMTVIVEDTDKTLADVRETAKSYGGYISDSNRWLVNEQPYASITLKVPAESLDQVMDLLRGMAIAVESENTSGQDVTEEYFDLHARLRNLEATETELLALLTEVRENRGKAEDILAIYRELTNIRSQIESLKGRTVYLERMSALATIQVEIRPKQAPRPLVDKAKWSPLVTISEALRGFVRILQVVLDLAIYLLVFSPFVLVPAVVLWLLIKLLRRRKKGTQTRD